MYFLLTVIFLKENTGTVPIIKIPSSIWYAKIIQYEILYSMIWKLNIIGKISRNAADGIGKPVK